MGSDHGDWWQFWVLGQIKKFGLQKRWFAINDGSSWKRYIKPQNLPLFKQIVNPDGSITLSIIGALGYADIGFYFSWGILNQIPNCVFQCNPTETFSINLYFDKDKDGQFFSWNGDTYLGVGGDAYILGPNAGPTLLLDDSTPFQSLNPGGGNFTLAQLRAGVAPNINQYTFSGIWVGIQVNSGSKTATIKPIFPQGNMFAP